VSVLGEVVAERSSARISAATIFRGFLLTRRAPLRRPSTACLAAPTCHYALPSDNYTRDKKILPAWKQQGFHTGYHYLENTAYVRQSCGAPSKHPLYVHGDGYEISLQTVPRR